MVRQLSKYEQETIINFNKRKPGAYIFTYEEKWKKHLEKMPGVKLIMDNGMGGKEYLIDKDRIRMPQLKRRLSNEVREKKIEQLRKARSEVKIAVTTQGK